MQTDQFSGAEIPRVHGIGIINHRSLNVSLSQNLGFISGTHCHPAPPSLKSKKNCLRSHMVVLVAVL
jgi:hypothetical protein